MFLSLVSSEEGASKHSALDGGLVDNDAILLVIASEACHGSDRIGTIGHLLQR